MVSDPRLHDRFVVARRRRYTVTPSLSRVEIYDFYLAAADEPICHVRQKVSRFNEDIRFYADDARTAELMHIKARPRFDPWARYEVRDPSGETIGEIEKIFGLGARRAGYVLYGDAGEEVARAEGCAPATAPRRLAGRAAVAAVAGVLGLGGLTFAGPGGLAGAASFVAVMAGREARSRVHPADGVWDFHITRDGERLGTHSRRPRQQSPTELMSTVLMGPGWATTLYDIDMSPDRARTVDRRLILALTVALDALRGFVAESPLR